MVSVDAANFPVIVREMSVAGLEMLRNMALGIESAARMLYGPPVELAIDRYSPKTKLW